MIERYFGYLSGVLAFLFYWRIIRSIIRGETRPSRSSWIIWTVNDILLLGSSFAVGVRNSIWLPLVYASCSALCLLLCFKHDKKPFSYLDLTCLTISVLAWLIWCYFNSPLTALILGVSVNTLGTVPTLYKLYLDPQSESSSIWGIIVLAAVAQLFALEHYTLALLLFPVNTLLLSALILSLSLRRIDSPTGTGK